MSRPPDRPARTRPTGTVTSDLNPAITPPPTGAPATAADPPTPPPDPRQVTLLDPSQDLSRGSYGTSAAGQRVHGDVQLDVHGGASWISHGRCGWCGHPDVEFSWYPAALERLLRRQPHDVKIAVTCRGTGDRPVLSRIAAALRAHARPRQRVIDIGAGAGGPTAWLQQWCPALWFEASEPSAHAVRCARELFPTVNVRQVSIPSPPVPAPAPDNASNPAPDQTSGRRSSKVAGGTADQAADQPADQPADHTVAAGVLMLGVLSTLHPEQRAEVLRAGRRLVPAGGTLLVSDFSRAPGAGSGPLILPGGVGAAGLREVRRDLHRSGWRTRRLDSGFPAEDRAWAAARDRFQVALARFVQVNHHLEPVACPDALHREAAARARFQGLIRDGAVRRYLLIAEAA